MDCPMCKVEMAESYKRIKFEHVAAKAKSTLKDKVKAKRVWTCPRCGKDFSVLLTLKEVEVVGDAF